MCVRARARTREVRGVGVTVAWFKVNSGVTSESII